MPEYLAPGVFIEEIERGPKPIEGVATSTAAFLGETERGPLSPRLVTSYGEYLRLYGGVFAGGTKYMPFSVKMFFDNGGRRVYITRLVGAGAATSVLDDAGYRFEALGPGAAGDRIFVRVIASTTRAAPEGGGDPLAIGFRVQAATWDRDVPGGVFDPFAEPERLPRPTLVEDFDDLTRDPDHPTYWEKMITDTSSALIGLTVDDAADVPDTPGDGEDPVPVMGGPLAGGADGAAPTAAQFGGLVDEDDAAIVDPKDYRGLAALSLDAYRDVAIVHAPGIGNDDDDTRAIQGEIVTHCERNRFRIAVLDAARNLSAVSDPRLSPRNFRDSQYAAFYYPWIYTANPRNGVKTLVPPGGATCGIYALTDNTRGVWKAPANVPVAGAIDLEFDVNTGRQEVLNPRGVNCIRRFPGRGIRMWGARTISSDPLWKYVSVRRLFIFLEASIYNSTQWVVFEPNDQRLWARVQQTVTLFLRSQWREGALFGAKEEEAFSVAVGRSTMTEDDILNGRLIVEIGIAPVRPAEFVVFRVFQKTQEAKT
ncbi:phage tail sheath family protein [Rhodobacterales bacterium HKCCE3408]|nr:phage tail sheath family protein [Rhodobacterales bacterium HKCCE3408]